MSFSELKNEALRLRPAQRKKLALLLMSTLAHEDAPITLDDLDRRSEDLLSGRVVGIPAEEVIASARKLIHSQVSAFSNNQDDVLEQR